MNDEILRGAPEHVREEHRKLRDLLGAHERGIELIVPALKMVREATHELDDALGSAALADVKILPGDPPETDAPESEWVEYVVRLGAEALESA